MTLRERGNQSARNADKDTLSQIDRQLSTQKNGDIYIPQPVRTRELIGDSLGSQESLKEFAAGVLDNIRNGWEIS